MSGIPDIGTLVRKSATADLRAPVSKDGAAASCFETHAARAPQHEAEKDTRYEPQPPTPPPDARSAARPC